MAVNVLVIPEDFRKDQYVLKPIIERMMRSLGVTARITVCKDPLLGELGQALNWERLKGIINRYKGMTRLFLHVVDRDGVASRRETLDKLESNAAAYLGTDRCVFLSENAWQELEVWVLAGQTDLPKNWVWSSIRSERDPKEAYYDPYAQQRGLIDTPYEGREILAKEAAKNYQRIRQLCQDDVLALEGRIAAALKEP